MIKYLLSKDGNFYKANLHSHTTVSDGELSPEKMKALYKQNGYSVLAFTDHWRFVTHNELTDNDFLILNGVENAADESGKSWMHNRCCDICFISLNKDNKIHPLQNPNIIINDFEYAPQPFEYTPYDINRMFAIGRKNGFFATWNHPTWSLEGYGDYIRYAGMDAMEIFNFSSAVDGYDEYNARIYDEMLSSGKRLWCIATDDNHNRAPGTKHWDSFGGFTMIKAETLTYEAVTKALLNGSFYSSRGPEITQLWIDTADNSIHIACPNAKKIVITRGGRRCRAVYAEEQGSQFLDKTKFSIDKDDIWFRITVFDEYGNTADTNAYFIDDLGIDTNNPNAIKE